MNLKVDIRSMDLPVTKPEVRSRWLRRLFRMPPSKPASELIGALRLEVKAGEVVTLVGESGAGKTTLLRILAGLEDRFEGEVQLGTVPIREPSRKLYLMPQGHTLLPWFTVQRNLSFFASPHDGTNLREAINQTLNKLGLYERRSDYPSTLSGGERARVALGCAFIAEPDVLLLDEPFRSLDQIWKERCEDDLLWWLSDTNRRKIVVIVSHSVSDAVFLGDRVVVLRGGPLSVYKEFQAANAKVRRLDTVTALEDEVIEALKDVSVQQQHAADDAARRR